MNKNASPGLDRLVLTTVFFLLSTIHTFWIVSLHVAGIHSALHTLLVLSSTMTFLGVTALLWHLTLRRLSVRLQSLVILAAGVGLAYYTQEVWLQVHNSRDVSLADIIGAQFKLHELAGAFGVSVFSFLIATTLLFIGLPGLLLCLQRVSLAGPLPITRQAQLTALGLSTFLAANYLVGAQSNPHVRTLYKPAIPGWCLCQGSPATLHFPSTLPTPPEPEEQAQFLEQLSLVLDRKPDIFLVILETLRADAVQKHIMPNLHAFTKKALSFPVSVSGASCTGHSWYSIFHSRWAYEWAWHARRTDGQGSLPLHMLAKAGYSIHSISYPQTVYKRPLTWIPDDRWMNPCLNMCFGNKRQVLDSDCPESLWFEVGLLQRSLRDKVLLDYAVNHLPNQDRGGHLYIVCLDGGHSPYTWSGEDVIPILPSYAPLEMTQSVYDRIRLRNSLGQLDNAEKRKVQNTYLNAVQSVDAQFGRLLSTLDTMKHLDDSIIVVTGDHGEMLFEHAEMFHGKYPYKELSQVPLAFRFLAADHEECCKKIATAVSSHTDIFPTLLDYLGASTPTAGWMVGQSIFSKTSSFAVCSQPRLEKHSRILALTNGRYKLRVSINQDQNIYQARSATLLGLYDLNDQPVMLEANTAEWVQFVRDGFEEDLRGLFMSRPS